MIRIVCSMMFSLLSFGSLPDGILAQSRVAPTQPRPVENWKVPPRSAEGQGSVIPQNPEAREIQPLQPPPRIEGPVFGNRPIEPLPEPPIGAEGSLVSAPTIPGTSPTNGTRELFKDSIHPIVLSPEKYLSINGQGVLLREGPGIDFKVAATLYQGDLVEWKDTDDAWHRVVIASGTDGWIASNLTEEVPQRVAVISGERVNLRESPSDQARVLGSLYQGAVAIAMETFGEWTQIRTPNLRNAYIASDYLKPMSDSQLPPFPLQPHPGVEGKVASLAKLSSNASGEFEYLLAVQPGDWVKGGKVGLIYLSNYERPLFGEEPDPEPRFLEGTFFEKLLFKDQFATGFPGIDRVPESTESILVGYLRGQKEAAVWTFPFKFFHPDGEGKFALCCQEGEHAGSYFLLEVNSLE